MPPILPSLAIVNARVWTGDPRRPWADAVLVHAGRIEAIGSSAEVKKRCTAETAVVDAKHMLLASSPSDWNGSGALRRGAPANLVLIRADLRRVTAEDLHDAEVLLEVRDGEIVLDRDGLTD